MTDAETAICERTGVPCGATAPAQQVSTPETRSPPGWLARSVRRFAMEARRQETLSLIDQVISSAGSFLTTLIVGRFAGPDELGTYALGFSLVMLCYSVHQSLVGVPYTVFANRMHGVARAEYAGAVLAQVGLLSVVAAAAMLAGMVAVAMGVGPPRLMPVLGVLAATIPFWLLREFARRVGFAHLRAATVLILDVSAVAIQVSGLVLLHARGALSAVSATLTTGLACALVAATGLVLARKDFLLRADRLLPTLRKNWAVGGWIFAGGLVSDFTSQSMLLWILAFTVSETATGVFAAASQIIRVCNPLILGIGQVLGPKLSNAFSQGGVPAARRVVWSMTRLFALTMGAFCVATFFGGGMAVQLLFGGRYVGYEQVITLMAVGALFSSLTLAPAGGLAILEHAEVLFVASLLQGAATLTVAIALLASWGIFGVACGLVAGQLVAFLVEWVSFFRFARRAEVPDA
jgi:O-antigen/teichoic acid export membrane protein